tara:strand:- start:1284 stop:2246 length:963 start_codon:yes stop_codon:yes gene_type:complete
MIENNEWKSILEKHAIEIKEYIGNDDPSAYLISNFAILSISGNDRYSFLQNQFTNNITKEKTCQLSAWCNPKGKVIANFIIIDTGKCYLLIFKKNIKDYLQKKLNLYVLRSNVLIEDVSSLYFMIGFSYIENIKLNHLVAPVNNGDIEFIDGGFLVKLPDFSGRYLLVANNKTIEDIIYGLKDSLNFTSYSNWEKLDILSKIPWIDFENKEKYLPQMINLDKLNAVSFKKGCYTGQEVIAKVHYRGKVKRTMKLVSSKHELYPGDHLYLDDSKMKVGDILNSSPIRSDKNFFGLAIIKSEKLINNLYTDRLTKKRVHIIK